MGEKKVLWAYGKRGYVIDREGELTFVSHRKWSKHFFRRYHAWGVSSDIITDIADRCVTAIVIIDTENETTYYTKLDAFLEGATVGRFVPFDTQMFLRLDKWVKENKKQTKLGGFDADYIV